MSNDDELSKKVEDWVTKEGISLEYFSANCFNRAGFEIFQGYYVKGMADTREIDVMGHCTYPMGNSYLRLYSVAECKWSKGKPWAVFNSPATEMTNSAVISETIGNEVGSALLWYVAGDKEICELEIFNGARICGFSGRQALGDKNSQDYFYPAIQGVVDKTVQLLNSYDNNVVNELKWIVSGFPMIIVDAPLFEINYDPASDTVAAKEVDYSRIRWRGSSAWKLIASVDVVTKKYLPTYLVGLTRQFDIMAKRVQAYLPDMRKFLETGDINCLNISEVSRGVGQPWFISQRINRNRKYGI